MDDSSTGSTRLWKLTAGLGMLIARGHGTSKKWERARYANS
jgi:hypothetical protein